MENPLKPQNTWTEVIQNLLKKKAVMVAVGIVSIVILYSGYQYLKGNATVVNYSLAPVTKGTLITAVSGTGQVDVENHVDVKSKVSAEVVKTGVNNSQEVKTGDLIVQLDSKEAEKAVRNANISLQSAQIALAKLRKPADEFTISQAKSSLDQAKNDLTKLQSPPTDFDLVTAENAVTQAQRDLDQAKSNSDKISLDTAQTQQKAYDDGYTAASNIIINFPAYLENINEIIFTPPDRSGVTDNTPQYYTIFGDGSLVVSGMVNDYNTSNKLYHDVYDHYVSVSRTASDDKKYAMLDQTLKVAISISQALESARVMLDGAENFYKANPFRTPTFVSNVLTVTRPKIQADVEQMNQELAPLQSAKNTIDTTRQNSPLDLKIAEGDIKAAEEKLKEKQSFLDKLKAGATSEDLSNAEEKVKQQQDALDKLRAGADILDIRTQELSVKDKENALFDAQQNLTDYMIVAPFDGIITKISASKGDTVSSGAIIATVITKQQVAVISLNEVDAAKIKVGQKTTLTFDAIENLTLTGVVSEIDTEGTVTQGVVTYNVKITFDTQDDRVKAGMSVSAAIITDARQDVLLVPNAAVKSQGNQHYVEMIDNPTPVISTTSNSDTATVTSSSAPRQQSIEIGISNDTDTEIVSGLNEGDQIVVKTTNTAKTTTTPAPAGGAGAGGLRIPGLGGGGRG